VESGKDIPLGAVYICSVCGYTSEEKFDRCPICGAPREKIKEF
ncbi:MAG: rubrerythrin family protein, partial [Candidatus Bathyarchaeota archaeon]|nr:rubrerythrin family protein [Candidatus Bathyarchaeota archaeon]